MKKIVSISVFLLLFLILFSGCSSNEKDKVSSQKSSNKAVQQDQKNESTDESEGNDSVKQTGDEDEVEDQFGLKLGESGIVATEGMKYEITLNSTKYADELAGIGPGSDTFMIVDVSVKNTGKQEFNGRDIYKPDISADDGAQSTYLNDAFERNDSGLRLLNDEIEPGNTLNGKLYFDTNKGKTYKVAFGHASSQIITRAEWEFSDDEIK